MTTHRPQPKFVESRDGKKVGKVVGTRPCQLEGCLSHRIGVRWKDGKITWPCAKGMEMGSLPDRWRIV